MTNSKKIPLSEGTPQYIFSLNSHRFTNLTHCPDCQKSLQSRKVPLLIRIEPDVVTVFSIDCHYCPACDWLILDQHKLEGLLAAFFMGKDPTVIGSDYVVVGTVEEAAWERGMKQDIETEQLKPYIHPFRELRPFQRQRKSLNLAGKPTTPQKRHPAKSKRQSRRQRKKGKRK